MATGWEYGIWNMEEVARFIRSTHGAHGPEGAGGVLQAPTHTKASTPGRHLPSMGHGGYWPMGDSSGLLARTRISPIAAFLVIGSCVLVDAVRQGHCGIHS